MVYGSTDGKTGKPATPNSLAFQWQAYMLQEHGREVFVNSANLAQLKQFIRAAGSDAQVLFTHGLSEWQKFRSTVYQSGQHDSLPAFPDIWFFAKHVSLLKTMFDNKDKPKSQYQISAYQHAADSTSNPEQMATLEQVLASIAMIEAMNAAKEKPNT